MTAFALAALLALAPVCRVWAAEGENAEQGTAASAEDAGAQTLEALMETFRAENGLDEAALRQAIAETGYEVTAVSARPAGEKKGLFGFLKR